MTPDPDDDALSWEGDSDTERPAVSRRRRTVGENSGQVDAGFDPAPSAGAEQPPAEAEQPPADEVADAEQDDEPAGLSTAMLLAVGVFGGIYLLYTLGWLIGGVRLQPGALFLIPSAMYTVTLVIAVAAPALWFTASWLLTRGARSWVRLAALIVGAILLVPWPFVMSGAGA